MNVKIGAKIKELRKRGDITQEQLAEFLGVTNQAISKWESENGYPDIEYISPIAKFFNVTIDYLFDYVLEQKERYKILVFDYMEINRLILCNILEPEYQVITANPEKSVLDCVMDEQPDLIIMEIAYSKFYNIEDISILRTNEATRNIPIIVVTAVDPLEYEAKSLNLGAVDYIEKPYNETVLKARVAAQLRIVEQMRQIKGKS